MMISLLSLGLKELSKGSLAEICHQLIDDRKQIFLSITLTPNSDSWNNHYNMNLNVK